MFSAVFDTTTLATYVAACFALVLVPGPLVRTANGGRRAGVLTTLGLSVGTAAHTVAAAVGLSALLAGSAVAFSILKYLGRGLPGLPRLSRLARGRTARAVCPPARSSPARC